MYVKCLEKCLARTKHKEIPLSSNKIAPRTSKEAETGRESPGRSGEVSPWLRALNRVPQLRLSHWGFLVLSLAPALILNSSSVSSLPVASMLLSSWWDEVCSHAESETTFKEYQQCSFFTKYKVLVPTQHVCLVPWALWHRGSWARFVIHPQLYSFILICLWEVT